MDRISAVIVDDEQLAIEGLRRDIERYCPDVEVTGTAKDIGKAVELIRNLKPQLVFLDIRLSNDLSFSILEQLERVDFRIIFVTAYNDYMLEAIRYSALDYLLKPVLKDELVEAVGRFREQQALKNEELLKLGLLKQNLSSEDDRKIAFQTTEGVLVIKVDSILFCEAEGSYTYVHMEAGDKKLISKNLAKLEQLLSEGRFCRAHHSFLVNLNAVESFSYRTNFLKLQDGRQVPVSHRKRKVVMNALKKKS